MTDTETSGERADAEVSPVTGPRPSPASTLPPLDEHHAMNGPARRALDRSRGLDRADVVLSAFAARSRRELFLAESSWCVAAGGGGGFDDITDLFPVTPPLHHTGTLPRTFPQLCWALQNALDEET